MSTRERVHRNTAESTNSRVKWWSIFQLIVLAAQGFFQVWWLKRFFEVSKTMRWTTGLLGRPTNVPFRSSALYKKCVSVASNSYGAGYITYLQLRCPALLLFVWRWSAYSRGLAWQEMEYGRECIMTHRAEDWVRLHVRMHIRFSFFCFYPVPQRSMGLVVSA